MDNRGTYLPARQISAREAEPQQKHNVCSYVYTPILAIKFAFWGTLKRAILSIAKLGTVSELTWPGHVFRCGKRQSLSREHPRRLLNQNVGATEIFFCGKQKRWQGLRAPFSHKLFAVCGCGHFCLRTRLRASGIFFGSFFDLWSGIFMEFWFFRTCIR